MRTAFGLLVVILMAQPVPCAQFCSGHKSEAQIVLMTPDQRVEEYCQEHSCRTQEHAGTLFLEAVLLFMSEETCNSSWA